MEELQFQMPAQGWSQFLIARKKMLDEFDRAKTLSKKHIVQTSHGNVAEAEFRKWLGNFLPKKYGVTSGYIISTGISDLENTPHFDVIIYEHLEAPILWIEESPDNSKQGSSLAIPAEYVKAVIEVKSSFARSTVKSGIEHLRELSKIMSGIDAPDERYKKYLPRDFFCSLVFFELRKENEFDKGAINMMVDGYSLRGYSGGVILRGSGHSKDNTGHISLLNSQQPIISSLEKPERSLLGPFTLSDTIKIDENSYFGAMLDWAEPNFSKFAFDLVALLNGTFESGRISSFHALGTTEWADAKKK
ncbi:hypothetical protein TH53_25325 [Pedobacter lusitanus]|uniref:DUF6602 domain-containing protein n=1 Tax=Pedobacter lusitanus TaxID=1503925 RepID=A0A0D0EZ11_9SPHI|nr:DUF6602 domain-containing protein [Pedobacter lusitanus]KIO74623.1 hypothetical protein TH53_25325 [Pedobacter lusitanus]